MNCLDYRRLLLAGDGESGPMRLHRVECVSCTETHREHAAFEAELRSALEVPIPEGLEERLGRRGAAPAYPGRRRWLAAASVAAVAAGAGLLAWRGRDDPMAMACIDFVMKDEAKSIMMGAMPRDEASRMLADTLPLERIERIGNIRHIAPCPLGAGTAYHVILMVPQDKVTLLVMPDTPMPARGRATQHGMYASVIPMRKGSVGVVGANAAVVESVVGAIRA
ncbi:MAG: DUF3379 family protein [Betaproteobacteria bacterium]